MGNTPIIRLQHMTSPEDAEILADKMVEIGKRCGRRVTAVITDMDTPLGNNIGNSIEVIEAVELLRGKGADDLREVCLNLAAEMVSLVHGITKDEAFIRAEDALDSGKAYEKFVEWIGAQGGDVSAIENTEKLPGAAYTLDVKATEDGYISAMNAEALGLVALNLGAGRRTKDDVIDFGAGIILHKKTGDAIRFGDVIATLYTNRKETLTEAESQFLSAVTFSAEKIATRPLIHKIIR